MAAARLSRFHMWRAAVVVAFAVAASLAAAAARGDALEVRGIALTVADLDRSVAFYEGALGFSRIGGALIAGPGQDAADDGASGARVRRATLRLGDESIELDQYLDAAGAPVPDDSRAQDLWFQHFAIVVRDMDAAYAKLARVPHQAISSAPQTIPASNAAAAGVRAYKFRDPDGHPLELLQFPPGKGNPKWQRAGDALFLGIDHSAITVTDTARSVRFWGEVGLTVTGGSLNSGPTQERLDGAPGAVVRITGLRPRHAAGPGLEFLEYLAPAGGRPAPARLQTSDIAHVHLVVEVDDLEALVARLARSDTRFVPQRPARAVGTSAASGVMVMDPDGHAALLLQRQPSTQPWSETR